MATFSEALKNIKNRSVQAARNIGFNEHFLPTLAQTPANMAGGFANKAIKSLTNFANNQVDNYRVGMDSGYFAPTEQVRTRDFFRELPGAANQVREFGAGMLQEASRGTASLMLKSQGMKELTPTTRAEKFVFGKDTITPADESYWAQKTGNPLMGIGATALGVTADVFTGGGKSQLIKGLSKIDDVAKIKKMTRGMNLSDEAIAAIAKTKDTKAIQGLLNPTKTKPIKPPVPTRRIHPDDLAEMADFTDYTQGNWRPTDQFGYEANLRDMAARYGINPNQSNKKLANDFRKVLDQSTFRNPNPSQAYKIPTSVSSPIVKRNKFGRYDGSRPGPKAPPSEAYGAMAGMEPEYDENGNITGFTFNEERALAGMVGIGAVRRVGKVRQPSNNFMEATVRADKNAKLRDIAVKEARTVRPPVVKIPDEIMNSQRGAEVYQELFDAERGRRIAGKDVDGYHTGEYMGQSSTFPQWVSESLRDRKLFNQVQDMLLDGKTPKPGSRAGDLYTEIYQQMTGTNPAKAQRALAAAEPSLNDLNATLPSRLTPPGKVRKVKADPEFESLIKSVNQEERFDRAVKFGEMKGEGKPLNPLIGSGEELQDISSIDASFKNVQRIFRKVFGKQYENVKQAILDPFDASKGKWIDEQNNLANSLKTDVIDRLGIKPKSRESELVQKFGEKEISLEELRSASPKWQQIVEADKWFRGNYDRLLDEVNGVRAQIYGSNSEKIIPRRQDYYRHFQELSGFEGLMNRLTGPSNIPTELAGLSDSGTKPKSKFLSFAQKRLGNKTEYDAVSGFLQYAKAAAYAKHIDPQINNFRKLADDLRTTSVATDNPMLASRFTEFLEDYANTLSGKTNPFDRGLQKMLGRPIMSSVDWLNSRVKANVILGNLSSSVAQAGNLPQIGANAGYTNLAKGMADTMLGINKPTKAINQSSFIKERYAKDIADQFDTSLFANTKKAAVWVTQALDEVATKAGWHAFYRQAVEQGIKNPTNYADNMVRDMVGGRGVGEVALAQQSRVTQLIAPFMIEVQNLWHVLGDNVGKKEFGKIVKFAIGAYAFNRTAEQIRGSGVTFDPIEAVIEAGEAYAEEENKGVGIARAGGRLAGEVLSNVMFGSTAAEFYPEYGMDIAGERVTREELFGDKDPTRFGSGLMGVVQGGVKDPFYKILPPFGGNQLKKTIQGVGATNQGYSETQSGRVRFPVEKNMSNLIRSAAFGQYGVPEARSHFDNNRQPLGDEQSEIFKSLSPQERKEFYDNNVDKRAAEKADDKMIAKIKAPGKNKAIASSNSDIMPLSSGKFYSKSLDKKYETEREAVIDVAKDKFKKSDKNIEVYGDTVFRKNKDGSVREQPKNEYDYSLNTLKMESLKKNKDLKGWSALAEKQVAIIEQQLQDSSLDELEQASLLKKAAAITEQYQKYAGYGGFKKPKVRKPGVQEAAQFALDTDRMSRSGDWQGWTKAATAQVNYLEGLKKTAKNQTELLQITNKQEDLQAKIAKVNQQRGFVRPPAMPSASFSALKMPSASSGSRRRVVAPPGRRQSKVQRTVRRPRVSGSQLANMR